MIEPLLIRWKLQKQYLDQINDISILLPTPTAASVRRSIYKLVLVWNDNIFIVMPFVSLEESEILKQQTNNLSFQMIVSAYLSTLAFNREKVQLNITNNRPKNNNLILIHIYSNPSTLSSKYEFRLVKIVLEVVWNVLLPFHNLDLNLV